MGNITIEKAPACALINKNSFNPTMSFRRNLPQKPPRTGKLLPA